MVFLTPPEAQAITCSFAAIQCHHILTRPVAPNKNRMTTTSSVSPLNRSQHPEKRRTEGKQLKYSTVVFQITDLRESPRREGWGCSSLSQILGRSPACSPAPAGSEKIAPSTQASVLESAIMPAHRYPCTGHVDHRGFGAFLESELGAARANLQAFTSELASHFAAPQARPPEVTLVNSGSSANLAAALALAEEVGRGAHAITAGFTFPTTLSALLFAGFEVTVVDSEPGGFGMCPEALRRAVRPETRVICLTHFLGFPAALAEISAFARERGLLILQDACETMDLRIGGKPAHSYGTLTTWSFYHPHHLTAHGGGAVVTSDRALHDRVQSLVHWGRQCTCHYAPDRCPAPIGMHHQFSYDRPGLNLEMSELNACFGRFQFRTWAEQEARRNRHYATLYETLVSLSSITVWQAPPASGSPFVFPIQILGRSVESVAARLQARGVEVRSCVGGVVSAHAAFRGIANDGLPRAQALSNSCFIVGIHQTLKDEDVRQVAAILREELSP